MSDIFAGTVKLVDNMDLNRLLEIVLSGLRYPNVVGVGFITVFDCFELFLLMKVDIIHFGHSTGLY